MRDGFRVMFATGKYVEVEVPLHGHVTAFRVTLLRDEVIDIMARMNLATSQEVADLAAARKVK
jgi:hypothetical protein